MEPTTDPSQYPALSPEQLARRVSANPDSYYFSAGAMQFFGDTMENYAVGPVEVKDIRHAPDETSEYQKVQRCVYPLLRKQPVKNGLNDIAYFDANRFVKVILWDPTAR